LVSFGDGVLLTIYLDWPLTMILTISASQIARITGVSHQQPASTSLLIRKIQIKTTIRYSYITFRIVKILKDGQ
jgi:hypothetical protein